MKCSNCGEKIDLKSSVTCTHCGFDHTAEMSESEDRVEEMIEKASVPNLASLFKQGKARGLIKPTEEYTAAT